MNNPPEIIEDFKLLEDRFDNLNLVPILPGDTVTIRKSCEKNCLRSPSEYRPRVGKVMSIYGYGQRKIHDLIYEVKSKSNECLYCCYYCLILIPCDLN
jgi:hypothetical protein